MNCKEKIIGFQGRNEENFKYQQNIKPKEREVSNTNKQEKKEEDDKIMQMIRNQIKIQYPQDN